MASNALAELPCGSISSYALGGTPLLTDPSPLDLYFNPAFANPQTISADGNVARLFGLAEFDLVSGGIQTRFKSLAFGLATTQLLASDFYSEQSMLATLSVVLWRPIRLGIGAERQSIEFGENYRSTDLYAISVGLLAKLRQDFLASLSVANLNRPRFERNDAHLPVKWDLSATYEPSKSITLCIGHHLDSRYPDRFSIGQSASISKELNLLLGLQTEPLELSGGIFLKLRGFSFEYGYCNNVYLGGTHRVGLRYSR